MPQLKRIFLLLVVFGTLMATAYGQIRDSLSLTKLDSLVFSDSLMYAKDTVSISMKPILSTNLPVIKPETEGSHISIEVQNFGQVESLPASLVIYYGVESPEMNLPQLTVPSLKPFEKIIINHDCGREFKTGDVYRVKIEIKSRDIEYPSLSGVITVK